MKGIILAAGVGSRLKPFSHSRPKHILPLANRPIICYAIDTLREAGISEIAIVSSKNNISYLEQACSEFNYKVNFILQENQLGTGDALKSALDFIGSDDALVYLGDNLFENSISVMIDDLNFDGGTEAALAVKWVDNPEDYGVVVVEGGTVREIVEKPRHFIGNLAVCGIFCLKNRLLRRIGELSPSVRGEYELTQLIELAIESGNRVTAIEFDGWWNDAGTPKALIKANNDILKNLKYLQNGELTNSNIIGDVHIEQGALVRNSIIRGPCHISSNAVIENAEIGPNVSVGEYAVIECGIVTDSIVDSHTKIMLNNNSLSDSVVGKSASILISRSSDREKLAQRRNFQVVLGDHSSFTSNG
ncbi:NTP transferase domain-containing protein [Deinococcus sp. KNUC1210]|uniref:sugar phosphate nucleotidyltransferase n=1 Tax=Deinococcus sp. KNUC1210 TaxID=2917691 RepID=UPI001EF13217|nr:sugar phosphate nucleotidyltransferase [Deinococcus sp. KNUC1210]ULH16598.1 NTP transferase domain-containing protein [Deinococcus sp. KNUC1210]